MLCEGVSVDSALVVLYTYGPYRSPIYSNGLTKKLASTTSPNFQGFRGHKVGHNDSFEGFGEGVLRVKGEKTFDPT